MNAQTSTLIGLGIGAFGLWLMLRANEKSPPTYTGAPLVRDLGWSYPPVYPDVTGSGAMSPTGTEPTIWSAYGYRD